MRLRLALLSVAALAAAAAVGQASHAPQAADPQSDLLAAVSRGNAALAAKALDRGADPNGAGPNDLSLAGAAAMLGYPDVLRLLLERGANPNTDRGFGSALTAAFTAMNGLALLGRSDEPSPEKRARALEVVRALAAAKADLNAMVRRGPRAVSCLMMAAEAGAADVVQILLAGGADPNVANGGGYTALDFAVDRAPEWASLPRSWRVDVVRALLSAGARTNRAGHDRLTPLGRARQAGHADIVALLAAAGAR